MLNFRKLKQEFPSRYLSQTQQSTVFEFDKIEVIDYSTSSIKIKAWLKHPNENDPPEHYTELEIDLTDSSLSDAKCSKCKSSADCVHVINTVIELEAQFDVILSKYSNTINEQVHRAVSQVVDKEHYLKESLLPSDTTYVVEQTDLSQYNSTQLSSHLKEAVSFFENKRKHRQASALLHDYSQAYNMMVTCPFFTTSSNEHTLGTYSIFILLSTKKRTSSIPIKLAIKIGTGKPKVIQNIERFHMCCKTCTPFKLLGQTIILSEEMFDQSSIAVFRLLSSHLQLARKQKTDTEKIGVLDRNVLGEIIHTIISNTCMSCENVSEDNEYPAIIKIPGIFIESFQTPLMLKCAPIKIQFEVKKTDSPLSRVILSPNLFCNEEPIPLDKVMFLEYKHPLLIYQDVAYLFTKNISPAHISSLFAIQNTAIPEALFGTLIEHSLTVLCEYAELSGQDKLSNIRTVPNSAPQHVKVTLRYWEGALEAKIYFMYDNKYIPGAHGRLTAELVSSFYTEHGIISRAIYKEQQIINELFTEFFFDNKAGTFLSREEKTIIDFMSKVIPMHDYYITFEQEHTLRTHFTYDNTEVSINIKELEDTPYYICVQVQVTGHMYGVSVSLLSEAISQGKFYLEQPKTIQVHAQENDSFNKVQYLIFNNKKTSDLIPLFNILGLYTLENSEFKIPSWKLPIIVGLQNSNKNIVINMSQPIITQLNQIVASIDYYDATPIPENLLKVTLRNYQIQGIKWIDKLRSLHFNGILADDMGLGKTLQIIASLLQQKHNSKEPIPPSLVICPTSLIYNWGSEFEKFTSTLSFAIVKGLPAQRMQIIEDALLDKTDVLITSYALAQKDIGLYEKIMFNYLVLDEAQLIKNHRTINAQTVRMIQAHHKLAATGTPVENSIAELWSLLDFLMPGLLGKRDAFLTKYTSSSPDALQSLSASISPFILRRMKEDVLSELPPMYEINLQCQLSKEQERLYREFVKAAKRDLSSMIKKTGFEKSKIHILGALTRLKQICCHPGIIYPEYKNRKGVSEKYDLLLNLLCNLSSLGHKTVVFSQYTQMLHIMRTDLWNSNAHICYLDGNTPAEERIKIVNQFNTDPSLHILLTSTKAGGVGLNLTGADTVIHYDMSWNPAVEAQASDRIHRIGQNKQVFVYKIITQKTIEDKILQIQASKKHISDSIDIGLSSSLLEMSWEDILEILKLD